MRQMCHICLPPNPSPMSLIAPRSALRSSSADFSFPSWEVLLGSNEHSIDLAKDHSEDLTVVIHLLEFFDKYGHSNGIELARRQDPLAMDLLFITQRLYGQFLNVVQEDLKDVFKTGKQDGEVDEILLQELGW